MRERRSGLIVYVSSVVGRMVVPFMGVYSASKWALEALAESSSYELRPFGVDVALVEPGAYGTNVFASMVSPDDTARLAAYGDVGKIFEQLGAGLAESAEGRSVDDIGNAILALANAPAGTRPLRTIVPENPAIAQINEHAAPIQRDILAGYGLGALLAPEAAAV